jgi:uncharacterized cupin superfamily protein
VAGYTLVHLKDVEDQAPKFGFAPGLEARFATAPLELERTGITYQRFGPGFRTPFGHRHRQQEELYVVVSGSARAKIDDEIIDLRQWDAVRVPGEAMRCLEAGPDGAEILAFGERTPRSDSEMTPNWWTD